jgi:succinoglycan biosynthesis protein ExoA
VVARFHRSAALAHRNYYLSSPAVTLIIPIRNEIGTIHGCIDSVLAQDYKNILEILIADGESDDGTLLVMEDYAQRCPKINIFNNNKFVQTVGLNLCLRVARGDVIVRLDAHATYAPDYISQCVIALEKSGAACVGGGVNIIRGKGYWPTLFGLVQEHPFGTGVARFRRSSFEGYVDTVWPGAYRREVFEKVGLFREHLNRTEDLDFHARLRKCDFRIWQTPLIRPYYLPRSTWKELAQQYFGNGEQVIETFLINRQAIAWRHLIPFLWITILAILAILAIFMLPMRIIIYSYLGVYFLACLGSSCAIGIKNGPGYLWAAPFVFLLIHLSYGVGSWWGIFRFLSYGQRHWIRDYLTIPRL